MFPQSLQGVHTPVNINHQLQTLHYVSHHDLITIIYNNRLTKIVSILGIKMCLIDITFNSFGIIYLYNP